MNTSAESTLIKLLHLRYLMPVVCQVILWFANLKDRRNFRKSTFGDFISHVYPLSKWANNKETHFVIRSLFQKGFTNKVLNFSVLYIKGTKVTGHVLYVSKKQIWNKIRETAGMEGNAIGSKLGGDAANDPQLVILQNEMISQKRRYVNNSGSPLTHSLHPHPHPHPPPPPHTHTLSARHTLQ